ncbi:nucleoside 2-deoxyribosyltransferase [Facklamia sp. DSM 111018]|uniref:Nucleoside 2-deoxyribosyltransferase n=1 Tax=Facklamia lactis TaxID=2749967 RepID=A0ABS0LQQ5_9LACT|nr:nucleoside 2-deoxyribosyltransferase [Facklamia lactis]MBG9980594.1 nucleoside 2-deoxyribosyltransferase [Facklamia lactis]MBG9986408.1 nucleoside 2-deoxyribosyltransferase [Facklamia lactis]
MAKLYFASPLFSEMELAFNQKVVDQLRQAIPELEIYLPQEQAEINDKEGYADSKMIATLDTEVLLNCDMMVAILDGQTIDPGVASEIGVAYQAGIPIIGLYSDIRQQGATNQQKIAALQEIAESQFPYANLYTVGLIKLNGQVVNSTLDLPDAIKTVLSKLQ